MLSTGKIPGENDKAVKRLIFCAACTAGVMFAQRAKADLETSDLALQLPFCFEVRTLSDRLVSSAPE
jgi:hypothetical protein